MGESRLTGARRIDDEGGEPFLQRTFGVLFAVFFVHVAAAHHEHGRHAVLRGGVGRQTQIAGRLVAVARDFHNFVMTFPQLGRAAEAFQIAVVSLGLDRAHVGRADGRAGAVRGREAGDAVIALRLHERIARAGAVVLREQRFRLLLVAFRDCAPHRHPVLVLGAFDFRDGVDQQLQIVEQIEPAAIETADADDERIFIGPHRQRREYGGLVFGAHASSPRL